MTAMVMLVLLLLASCVATAFAEDNILLTSDRKLMQQTNNPGELHTVKTITPRLCQ
jgi:hypothetical protein